MSSGSIDYETQAHNVTTWINISIVLIASGSVVAWIARSAIGELINSRKAAEAANRAKSQFLANVSHELRTPLNTILGFTNVLLEQQESLTPTQREQLTIIAHSGNSLRRLIDDILDLVRADSERLKLHEQATELLPIIKSIIDTVRPDCERKGLNLHVSTPELLILLDGERLRQIILNLLNNAIKFTPQGEIGLTINYQIIDEAHIDLMITVTDTGPGISLMDQERIFLPFERVNKEGHHTNVNGLGLGLAICQQLTKLMGGKLLINSIAGQGSTFILNLPAIVTLKSPINPTAQITHVNYSVPIATANLTANDLPLDTDLAMLLELAEVRMISELQDWIQVNMDSYPQFTKLLDELVRSCDLPKVEAFLKNIYEHKVRRSNSHCRLDRQ